MSTVQRGGPTFSVIMPVYNHAQWVAQAIESVLEQTVGDWELIVVDDGSTDGTPRVLQEFAARDRRITVLRQDNAGPSAARNVALARATGAWLTYLDSDDLWLPDALAHYRQYIESHPEATFLYGFRHRLTEDGAVVELPGEFQDRPTGARELFDRMYLSHLCVCYRRELIDQAGAYNPALHGCEDYELYLRMSRYCRFEPIGKATGLRRRHEGNLSTQTGFSRMQEGMVLRRYLEQFGGRDVIDPQAAARRLAKIFYAAGRQYFKARCFRQCCQSLALASGYRWTLKIASLAVLSRLLSPLGKADPRELPKL